MKTCTKCKIEKSIECFSKHKLGKNGLRPNCKQCIRDTDILNKDRVFIRAKLYREKNKEKLKQKRLEYYAANKQSIILKTAQYQLKHKEQVRLTKKRYKIRHKDKVLKSNILYKEKNKENIKKVTKKYNKYYRSVNKHMSIIHTNRRRASKLNRTPKWLTKFDLDYIKHIYIQAKELEKLDNIKRHVDHVIPLQGKTVSGLHVPWNLQILTAEENTQKRNKLLNEAIYER